MTPAHVHLLVNHFPLIGTVIGFLLLLGSKWSGSRAASNAALSVLAFSGLMAIPAHFSGEAAEEMLEQSAQFNEALVEEHEERAKVFMLAMLALGLSATAALLAEIWKPGLFAFKHWLVAAIAAVGLFLAVPTGSSGGAIMHPEIREGAASQTTPPPAERNAEDEE
ncbi:MAG: hypothetical protein KBF37_02790 [Saprospiraceae bacterium]|jgi:nitrogen fixation/metabolism regulation signal transduction histidine kinase|nr:hypothetical protein [Saprospiraceae bacterium]MBP9209226.1 hypothetical protein [Saprospiraceae bacterium]MBV6473003.1 hypothetical protein [Saprospiraceae bacterium]